MFTLNTEILARLFRNFKNKTKTRYYLHITNSKYKIVATTLEYTSAIVFTIEELQFSDSRDALCFEIPLELQTFLDSFKLKTINVELTLEKVDNHVIVKYENILNVSVDLVDIKSLITGEFDIDCTDTVNFSNVIKVLDFIPFKFSEFELTLNEVKVIDNTNQLYFEASIDKEISEANLFCRSISDPVFLASTLSRFSLNESELMYSDKWVLVSTSSQVKLKDKSIVPIEIMVIPNKGSGVIPKIDLLTLENSNRLYLHADLITHLSGRESEDLIPILEGIKFRVDWFNKMIKPHLPNIKEVLYKDHYVQLTYNLSDVKITALSTLYRKVEIIEEITDEEFSGITDVLI